MVFLDILLKIHFSVKTDLPTIFTLIRRVKWTESVSFITDVTEK